MPALGRAVWMLSRKYADVPNLTYYLNDGYLSSTTGIWSTSIEFGTIYQSRRRAEAQLWKQALEGQDVTGVHIVQLRKTGPHSYKLIG